MAAWPGTLPKPDMNQYQIESADPLLRTEMDSGPARVRRVFTSVPEFVDVKFKFSLAELGIFEKFWKETLFHGADWFDIDLANGAGENTVQARFTAPPKRSTLARENYWTVTARLEVRNFPVVP